MSLSSHEGPSPHAPTRIREVAIIGAGLAGLTLALTLQAHSITSTIYERRSRDYHTGRGNSLSISPNALRVLAKMGVYESLRPEGCQSNAMTFRRADGSVIDVMNWGDKDLHGFPTLRIFRDRLLRQLKLAADRQGIVVHYDCGVDHVVQENDNGVTFALSDGTMRTADLLIAADGTHSKIRKQYWPHIVPVFQGVLAVFGTTQPSAIRLPSPDYTLPTAIVTAKGAIMIVPTVPDESEASVVRQFPVADRSREEWDKLQASPADMLDLLAKDIDAFPEVARTAVEGVDRSTLTIWPHALTPMPEDWVTPGGKVVLVGDAAHSIPPSGGQGANQAIEDAHTLGLAIAMSNTSGKRLNDTLTIWQECRKERRYGVLEFNALMNQRRSTLAAAQSAKPLEPELVKLYGYDAAAELLKRFDG